MNRLNDRIQNCVAMFEHYQREKWGLEDARSGIAASMPRDLHYMRGFTDGETLKRLDEKETKDAGHDLTQSDARLCATENC